MSTADSRRKTLEALTELKAEYYIGSLDAFRYLQEMRLCEQIQHSLPADTKLTLRHIGTLLHAMAYTLSRCLEQEGNYASSPKTLSLDVFHVVMLPHDNSPKNDQDGILKIHYWSFDYIRCLGNFIVFLTSISFPVALGFTDQHQGKELGRILLLWTTNNLHNRSITLTYQKTGEVITLYDFIREARFHEGENINFLWGKISAMLDQDDLPITPTECAILEEAIGCNDIETAYPIIEKLIVPTPSAFAEFVISRLRELFASVMTDADQYLYGYNNLYERAEREYTLGYQTIERRIALNFVYGYLYGNVPLSPDKAVHVVSNLIALCKEREEKYFAQLTQQQAMNAPQMILQSTKKLLQKTRYYRLALFQNKKWLIHILSH